MSCWLSRTFFLAGLLAVLCGCQTPRAEPPLQRFEFSSPRMGTLFTMTLYAPDADNAKSAAEAAFRRVADLDSIMSDYDATSELMRLCDQPAGVPVPVSADLFDVLWRAQKISQLTDGAFDVTVGPYVRMWRMARKKKVLPTQEQIAEARASVGYRKLKLDSRARTVTLLAPNMRLDLGGIAKGYAADDALRVLKSRGITRGFIAASGDIAIGDPPPEKKGWSIGISAIDPKTNDAAGTVVLSNAGISTSGDTEQFVEINGARYSHIVSPATGLGLTHRIQVSVIARDATTTDALGTALCVLGPKRGLPIVDSIPGAAALVTTKGDGQVNVAASKRWKKIEASSKVKAQSSR